MDFLDTVLVVSPTTLTFIGTILVPGLVAILTKQGTPAWFKSTVDTLFVGVIALVGAFQKAGEAGVSIKTLVGIFIFSIILSQIAYDKIWKPLGLWSAIQAWTQSIGFGERFSEQPLNPNTVMTSSPGGVWELQSPPEVVAARGDAVFQPEKGGELAPGRSDEQEAEIAPPDITDRGA